MLVVKSFMQEMWWNSYVWLYFNIRLDMTFKITKEIHKKMAEILDTMLDTIFRLLVKKVAAHKDLLSDLRSFK